MKKAPWYLLIFALIFASNVDAQVKPNASWRTLRTRHFYIHFTPEVEDMARRAAVQAESAYVQLSRYLTEPRGPIDVVISDDVDFTNGFATPFPSNRIVFYANPPVFEGALRFTDDPTQLIITHELTHVFHLDRAGGLWGGLQRVFGRNPFFFPNAFQPSWLVEGIAVHFESELTGSGRLEGSEHRMIARTAATAHRFPRLDQLSLARPHFPYGYSAYAYGSLFVDHLAKTHGDSSIAKFIESSARQLIPMYLNPPSRRAFGRKFGVLYKAWAKSLLDSAPPAAPPIPGWRDLTVDGAYAAFPRWLSDSTLVYTGTPGDESYGAYRLQFRPTAQVQLATSNVQPPPSDVERKTSDVRRIRIGRRDARSPNALMPDGSLLYSQVEYTSPYNLRSDLYLTRARGGTRRLTRGARLATPDARRDGLIVAVQTVPAGTRLALVSSDGRRVAPITSGGLDEQWSEPRWSPDGNHIAAVRWTRGGTSEIVVIDTTGGVVQTLIRERAVNATPSWSVDGRSVYFASDRDGTTNLYRAAFGPASSSTASPALQRVSDTQSGLFEPQLSPNGEQLAAVVFKADGYHVGVVPVASLHVASADSIASVSPRNAPPVTSSQAPSTRYSPWRTLLPRYWMPFGEPALDENSTRIGALVSGEDVVGIHAYQALLFVPTDNSGLTGAFAYRNARLGRPIVELAGSQDWENYRCIADASQQNLCIGTLRRRIRDATLAFTFPRPRARSFSYASLGVGVEARAYGADSTGLLDRIDSLYRREYYYPRAIVSAGWSNTQHPPLAISPEDGISLATSARWRWRSGDTATFTTSVVGTASAYKSLDLPGFAHHVLALRAAGGMQDNRGTGYFEVGGVSGGTVDIVPGYVLGEGRRSFGVRGFPAASLVGMRAFQGSVEYRAPFTLPGRGLGTMPLFLDRTSITVFGDAGSAWCPGTFTLRAAPNTTLCSTPDVVNGFAFTDVNVIASTGAELNVSAAILSWDAPFRYRVGFAVPVAGTQYVFGDQKPSWYFAVGVSF